MPHPHFYIDYDEGIAFFYCFQRIYRCEITNGSFDLRVATEATTDEIRMIPKMIIREWEAA